MGCHKLIYSNNFRDRSAFFCLYKTDTGDKKRSSETGIDRYRFGFNGKENDDEVKGDGSQQDYGMRIYDPRLGRFLSVDPIAKDFPWYTPYQFAGNKPIESIDLDGLEDWSNKQGKQVKDQNGKPLIGPLSAQTVQVNQLHEVSPLQKRLEKLPQSSPCKKEEPKIQLKTKIEFGPKGALEAKVAGIGLGGHYGLSIPIISTTISEQGTKNTSGGTGSFSMGATMGPIGADASVQSNGETSLSGSIFHSSGSVDQASEITSEYEVFSFKGGLGIIGSVSLKINTTDTGHSASPDENITGYAPKDNTNTQQSRFVGCTLKPKTR